MITHCSFYLFSIWHVYGHASLLRWVYVLERVHMGASLWDSILVYVLGDSMSCLFVFCERGERPFFRISGALLYSSSHLFRMWLLSMLWYRLTITHFLSFCLLLSSFYSYIPPYLIWFLSFLILLDVWLGFRIHTLFLLIQCVNSFIITFHVGTPRFGIHDVFYALHFMHEGYGDYIIRIFEPSFLSFRSPYYLGLRYVTRFKTTLRPWLHTLCLTTHTWAILEIGWRLFLGAWRMGSWGDGFTLGHTLFISDGFSKVIWSILGHTLCINDGFLVGWPYIGA